MKEMKAVEKDDKTHKCKVKPDVLVDAQRRMYENPKKEYPMEVG